MDVADYRNLLVRSIHKPPAGAAPEYEIVLILVGSIRGLGADGTAVSHTADNRPIYQFTRAECRRMLAKLDRMSLESK